MSVHQNNQNFEQKYNQLLIQFNDYREKCLLQKQSVLRDFEKYKAHLDKTYKQIEKKYENKLQEQRINYQKKQQKLQATLKSKEEDLNALINSKNKFIQQLKNRLMEVDRQKHQIIQHNTQMLYQLSQGIQTSEQILGPNKSSYLQLSRLYQFVLQQNNSLKKQLYKAELKHYKSDATEGKDDSRLVNSKPALAIPKGDKNKKKPNHTVTENSKQNYDSAKIKNTNSSHKKQLRDSYKKS